VTTECRIGGENLGVAQNTYAVRWFNGRELNMVFGLQLSFSRVVCRFCFFAFSKKNSSCIELQFIRVNFICVWEDIRYVVIECWAWHAVVDVRDPL